MPSDSLKIMANASRFYTILEEKDAPAAHEQSLWNRLHYD